MSHRDDLAARKALLVAQASLQRMQATLAWHDVKSAVMPPMAADRGGRTRTAAKWVVRLAVPLFGLSRASRVLRMASIGLTAWRIVQGFRSTR
jgi:hypothetical protein